MGKWKISARIYHLFRRTFPVNLVYKRELENVRSLLDRIANEPGTVLDLGTGIGETLPVLYAGKKRVLLDFSLEMLARTDGKVTDRKVLGDIVALPFRGNQFDLITCIGVSEYVQPKAVLLREIFDCLNENGYALITFSPKNMYTRLRRLLGKKLFPLSGSTAYDLVAAQGFFVVWVYKSLMQTQFLLQKIK